MAAMSRLALSSVLALTTIVACGSSSTPAASSDAGSKDTGTTETGAGDTGTTGISDTGSDANDTGTGDTGTTGCASATVVTGTLSGQALSPAYAVAFKGVDDSSYPNQISIFITNVSNLCSIFQTNGPGDIATLRAVSFVLGATDPSAGPVTPGTYTEMNTVDEMTAEYDSYNSTCQDTSPAWNGGSVVVCGVGTSFTGTFNLTFGTDTVTGTFNAPLCNLNPDAGAVAGDGGIACLQP
jgi:hypothetical protein